MKEKFNERKNLIIVGGMILIIIIAVIIGCSINNKKTDNNKDNGNITQFVENNSGLDIVAGNEKTSADVGENASDNETVMNDEGTADNGAFGGGNSGDGISSDNSKNNNNELNNKNNGSNTDNANTDNINTDKSDSNNSNTATTDSSNGIDNSSATQETTKAGPKDGDTYYDEVRKLTVYYFENKSDASHSGWCYKLQWDYKGRIIYIRREDFEDPVTHVVYKKDGQLDLKESYVNQYGSYRGTILQEERKEEKSLSEYLNCNKKLSSFTKQLDEEYNSRNKSALHIFSSKTHGNETTADLIFKFCPDNKNNKDFIVEFRYNPDTDEFEKV